MPQNVPAFTWTDDAVRLRAFVYEFWCEHGVGPNLRDVHEALGMSRRQALQAYKELELGTICVIDTESLNGNLLKCQPFSSFPSQVKAYVDGRFHSFAGCAMESVAYPKMPPFSGKEVRFESFCACCLAPVTTVAKDLDLVSADPHPPLIHVSLSPFEWNNVDITRMCDSMNFVLDADHAERFEAQVGRRGVLFTLDQARGLVRGTADSRMWDAHWGVVPVMPEIIIDFAASLGVDVTAWRA